MSYRRNHRKPWNYNNRMQLRALVEQNTPINVICLKTGRSRSAIRAAASDLGIRLVKTNQRPYGKR